MLRRLQIVLPAALLAAGASLALAACGGTSPSTAATKATAQENLLKFARCMREHGVNVPDPRAGQPLRFTSSNPPAMEAAQNACKRYRAGQEISPAEKTARLEGALKFARCMRAHGVQIPDPSTSGGGVGIKISGGPGSVNPSSPTFQAAQTACQGLLGKGAPKGGFSVQSGRAPQGGGPKGGAVVGVEVAPNAGG
jgi:hypothetical protein